MEGKNQKYHKKTMIGVNLEAERSYTIVSNSKRDWRGKIWCRNSWKKFRKRTDIKFSSNIKEFKDKDNRSQEEV